MPGGGGSQTIGYKYKLGMHLVLCHGPIDQICKIEVDGRVAWDVDVDDSAGSTGGPITLPDRAANLFGGDKREGGVGGIVDVDMGGPGQGQNAYLLTQLGEDTPSFRGVVSLVLNQAYVGNNPYLKAWAFCAQRIHLRQNGIVQWYDEKAAIGQAAAEYTSYAIMEAWSDPDFGGGTGLWYREPTTGTTPVADGTFGTFWKGTSLGGTLIDINDPGIPIGNVSRYYGSITIPPLPTRAFIRVRVYHDDFMDGGISVNGGAAVTLEKDSYYYSHIDVVLPANDASSVVSFSYSVIQGVPSGTTTGFGGGYRISVLTPEEYYLDNGPGPGSLCSDMNPAHIIRECLTDPDWGMGYVDADIDDTSFIYAADSLFDEVMGISLLWDRQVPLEDFIAEILRHIDGVLYVDRMTGKFVLKLIRDDYALSELTILNESNVSIVSNARRPTIGELTNSITVNYYDGDTGETGSVGIQDQALIQIQSATIGTTIQYPGFTNRNIASRVAQRDLKALSVPLLSAEIVASREASYLNVGDAFLFSWPDLSIDSVVMRVQQLGLGNGRDNSISISAVEDVFSLSSYANVLVDNPETGLWVDPADGSAMVASPRLVAEAPYYQLVTDLGQLSIDTILADDPDAGYTLIAAGRQANEINATIHTDSGAGYVDRGTLDFCPYATVLLDIGFTDTQIYIDAGTDLDLVSTGTIAQIEDELVRVDGFATDSNGYHVLVGRGILDTVPAEHPLDSSGGPKVIFWGFSPESDEIQYTASDSVNVKLTTVSGSNELEVSDVPGETVVFDSRAIRPYPPGNLKIDGISYPTNGFYTGGSSVTWVGRDRLQQTSGTLYDYTEGAIGPEAGVTYRVTADAILSNGNISSNFIDSNVGTDTFYDIDSNAGEVPATATHVRFKVHSVRGGYESLQPAMAIINYEVDSNGDDDVKILLDTITNPGSGEFVFSGIPSGYSRLVIEGYIRGTVTATVEVIWCFLNADTTSTNYHRQLNSAADGTASAAESAAPVVAFAPAASSPANSYGSVRLVLENYTGSNLKSIESSWVAYRDTDDISIGRGGIISAVTAAVTTVTIRTDNHSTDTLLGSLRLYGES